MGTLRILSIDHGAHDLDAVAVRLGADPRRIPAFKVLTVEALRDVAAGRPGFGTFLDGALGGAALAHAARHGLWIARQYPHGTASRPGDELASWAPIEVVKLILNGRPDARVPLAERLPEVQAVAVAAGAAGRPMLIEALPAPAETTAAMIGRLKSSGLRPAWWLVEAEADAAGWHHLAEAAADARFRGFVVIARTADVAATFRLARTVAAVTGFVAGRSAFGPTLEAWLAGQCDDSEARSDIAARFGRMAENWDNAEVPTR